MKKNSLIGIVLVIILWGLVSKLNLIQSFFLPGPMDTFLELSKLILDKTIIKDILITLERVGLAFIISLIGIPIGLFLGSSRNVYESFEFVIDFFRSIPATAMFPLFLLIFGISDGSKIAVAAFASALIITFNTAYGVINSKKIRKEATKLMGASKLQIFRLISFWESLPQTFIGLRTALSLCLVIIVVTEMFIGTYAGLGRKIIDFQYVYDIKGMYAVILLTGIIGYLLNYIFVISERKLIHWNER